MTKERNSLSTKIKELEEIMFKVKLTEQKMSKSIIQSPRDDLADSECSFKTASSSHFMNVSNNPLFYSDDNHTSEHKNQIRPSNLFYVRNVDGSGKSKKTNSKEKWIWKRKGSSDEEKDQKSFVHTPIVKKNNSSKGKTFGKPDLVYTVNQLIMLVPNSSK
ncbi:hypothetical protein L6452_36082 [Arctium lappa]|uniref:Uncharacterized protein n=1 Tax=Arctium lappa TaxID=4217 RepID=A0ACB8Y9P2_ARCLA|nr:hypothetical protein L6452_36082 [Arctium lappa]